MKQRSRWALLVFLTVLLWPALIAAQQVYPIKPIRFIVPFPPGGSTDPLARLVAQKLTESWGQSVIVDNRGGGNTVIGTEAVAKAPPDGYTILLISSPFFIGPSLLPHLPYDTIKDFDPVATIAKSRYILAVHPSVPANTLQEFIALAKSRPGELNYASSAIGGTTHLAPELFNLMAGTRITHIPYKGGGPALTGLIAGQVEMVINNPLTLTSSIKGGKIKALAITGEARLPILPQVPTFDEAGLPGYDMAGWFGIVAPAGTPQAVIDKLSSETARIMALPDITDKLFNQGMETFLSTPTQVAAQIKADIAKFARIVKAANIKVED